MKSKIEKGKKWDRRPETQEEFNELVLSRGGK